jgi:acrylyl-CoA reductase (NADPH)
MTQPVPQLPDTFRALRAVRDDAGFRAELQSLPLSALPEGDTLVRVTHSSLNYKDGLAVAGKPGVLRSYPMTPGIDLAGTVVQDDTGAYEAGAEVLLTGWGIGERQDGGYADYARVRSGEVLVTGAAGGVGSTAVALLAAAGFTVTASTGRPQEEDYLRSLGATNVIGRGELPALKRPLEKERWAGVIDSVGGDTLAGAVASTRTHGAVAACGLAGGSALSLSVFPFILRGVNLLGIDSVTCPQGRRGAAWTRLARDLPAARLADVTQVRPLSDVPALAQEILAGQVRGRTVIRVAD